MRSLLYTDSTGNRYTGMEWLAFGDENGKVVVISCEMVNEMVEYTAKRLIRE